MEIGGAGILYLISSDPPSKRRAVFGISANGELEIPGGRSDESDKSAIHTAVRESIEECGIHPNIFYPLVSFIAANPWSVKIEKDGKYYILYIVKITEFDFAEATHAAVCRSQEFQITGINPHLVEMIGYVPVQMWGDIGGRKCEVGGFKLRDRDCAIIKNDTFLKTMYYVSRTQEVPVFDTRFSFIKEL
jgi:8-oxo-dGTP pyrophosphatase MutT (NUDIX family)